jgi:hypothetical protein
MTFSMQHGWKDPSTGRYVINWREHLVCPHCGLNNRMRATLHFLDTHCPSIKKDSLVYVTEQSRPLYSGLGSFRYTNLIGSEYLGNACALGHSLNGIRNEDMTHLTFPDRTLAAVLSFDVLGIFLTTVRP